MTFANVCANQEQLTLLSQLLLTAFPGCTIYQDRDPKRTIKHLSNQKIDAIFADVDTCSDWIHIFRKHRSNPTVLLLYPQERQRPEESKDIYSVVTYPITNEKIQNVLQTRPREIREVI